MFGYFVSYMLGFGNVHTSVAAALTSAVLGLC